jgi:uncharacterized protein (TIGR02598 family)
MKKDSSIGAFSLVEVALALGVTSFCLIVLFGLLPTGLNSNQASSEQTGAADILAAVSADLRSTPKANAASPHFSVPIPGGGTLYFRDNAVPDTQANSRYRVAITFVVPANRTATTGRILITWPARQDDPAKANAAVEAFIALDRN